MKRSKAFSLVEISVVVATFATMVGILLPPLRAARQRSRTVVCLSNQK